MCMCRSVEWQTNDDDDEVGTTNASDSPRVRQLSAARVGYPLTLWCAHSIASRDSPPANARSLHHRCHCALRQLASVPLTKALRKLPLVIYQQSAENRDAIPGENSDEAKITRHCPNQILVAKKRNQTPKLVLAFFFLQAKMPVISCEFTGRRNYLRRQIDNFPIAPCTTY